MEFNIATLNRSRNAYKQSQDLHYCRTCDSWGQGQKMYGHIKNCDGSGLKNYWSRVRSEYLKSFAVGMLTLDDVDNLVNELKEKSRRTSHK